MAPMSIHVKMPAIILLNPENAGSLTAEPRTPKALDNKKYWDERALIITMRK